MAKIQFTLRVASPIVLIAFVAISATSAFGKSAVEMSDAEFDAARHNKDRCLLALFHADWSYSARKYKREFDEIATHFDERSNFSEVDVVLVDGHKYRQLARRESVHVIPLVVFYMWGGDPQVLGAIDTKTLIEIVEGKLGHDAKHRLVQEAERTEHARRNIPHPHPGNVVELVTQELFDEQVKDVSKLAFVLFYANWCHQCTAVMPMMDELAKYFEPDPKVVIAKVDCADNNPICAPYEIEGFPTFMLFGKNKEMKSGMKYLGDREVVHLRQWLDVHNNVVVDYNSDATHQMHQRNLQRHDHQRLHQEAMPHHYEDNMHPTNRY